MRSARLLGLDLGRRRIGVSVSDPLGIAAQGVDVIERTSLKETLRRVRDSIARHEVGAVVVGLPLNMNGTEGDSARDARRFAGELERFLKVPVIMWDERLTTAEAERALKSMGLTRRKRSGRIDSVAAQIILQSYLDCHRGAI